MSDLRVSIVMPSYNQARFIRQAIDSILYQDYQPLHLFVVDGGSTDGTVDILRSYGDRLEFVSRRDRGQSDALNYGLFRADGDIVCWLNSDDAFLPDTIPQVARAFRLHPEADFVYGKGYNIDEHGRCLGDSGVLPFNLWKLIHHRNYIHQPSCFFRRSLLDKVGPIVEDMHYIMDWELWIRFGAHRGVFLDQFLSCNRVYGENKTQGGGLRRWREIRRMVRSYTSQRLPPVLWLYMLEILVVKLRARDSLLRKCLWRPLDMLFHWGMGSELSGVHGDGLLEPVFRFSVPNRTEASSVRLTLSPLSRYDRQLLAGAPVTIDWRSSSGQTGRFELRETAQVQEVLLPLDREGPAPFTHFRCRANSAGRRIPGSHRSRRAIAFLDDVAVVPVALSQSVSGWPLAA